MRDVLQTTPEERYRKMGCVNRQMLGQKLGMNTFGPHGKARLDKWAQEGRLTPKKTPSPDNGKPTVVHPIIEANTLAAELGESRGSHTIHRNGKDYLHRSKVSEILNVKERNTIYLWRNNGVTPLGGDDQDLLQGLYFRCCVAERLR